MDQPDRDAQTILAVRTLVLMVGTIVLAAFAVAGAAKIIDPSYDAGHLALLAGVPVGGLTTLVTVLLWRRRSTL
jgi:hypothetical protein